MLWVIEIQFNFMYPFFTIIEIYFKIFTHNISLDNLIEKKIINFIYVSIIGSRNSHPGSLKFGYNFTFRPSPFKRPWNSGFLSFGVLRCSQISRKLFDELFFNNCFCNDTDDVDDVDAGGDIGESVVARITLARGVSSFPILIKMKNKKFLLLNKFIKAIIMINYFK